MSTAVTTGRSKAESGSKREYIPGAPVDDKRKAKRPRILKKGWSSPELPIELLDKILGYMVESRTGLSVIKLSMVNRFFRQAVAQNIKMWYQLYLHWRGPINPPQAPIRTPRAILRLRPTVPRSVPNFRDKPPPTTLIMSMDKMPGSEATEAEKQQAVFIYRKITCLLSVPCCGMCGTFRHATKPFWCLGMRLCRHCVQANLVSSLALYERYWVTFKQPVQLHRSFVDAVCMNVFFFSTRVTARQRMEFSCDRMDFPGGIRTVWFFWKPHLARVLNMEKLERDGKAKHDAASAIRGHARRALVLRALRGTKDRKKPTLLPTDIFTKRDLRCTEFRLRKTELLDKVDVWQHQRMSTQLTSNLYSRLSAAEDRVVPFMYN